MHTSSLRRGSRRRLRVVTLSALALAMVISLAGPSVAQSTDLAIDEISSSNLELVTNIPRQGPLSNDFHSDMAFWGNYLYQGTYGGVNIYDIKQGHKPRLISQIHCPGGQGDVTISEDGRTLHMSVDAPRTDSTCSSSPSNAANPTAWEGIRIFDVSDVANPVYLTAVRTDCGSHTHTLIPGSVVDYLYVSSYGPNANFPNCQPPHDSISIIEVPHSNPAAAAVVNKPNLFPDGGAPRTAGCHDITVFPQDNLAAGACMGDGVLMDISDPVNPVVITRVQDPNFAFWHSATLLNDGRGVLFTDELGGGGAATCNEAIGPERGANAIYDIVGEGMDRELVFRTYYKIPRHQQNTENCVAHNGMLLPVKGRDIYVQSWYQGGVSVFDFTDPTSTPQEIAYFERGPAAPTLTIGGSWSAYYYNGYIYSSDILKGLDVLKVTGLQGVSSANHHKVPFLNPQTQYTYKDVGRIRN